MDHSEALRLQAAEKYVLGELSPALRDEYEEHYFDCQECAADIKAAVAFADATRATFRSDPPEVIEDKGSTKENWLAWLRPAALVPAMAVFLAILAYQNLVTIPNLRHGTTIPPAGSAGFISLIGANSRGGAATSFAIQADQPIVLEVDIPPSEGASSYLCQIQDGTGRTVYQSQVPAADAKQSVHLIVPAGTLQPQPYTLRVQGQRIAGSGPASPSEVTEISFTIAFRP